MPREVDRLLRYPRGRSLKLAKAGKLAHVRLPDGEIRFDQQELQREIQEKFTQRSLLTEVSDAR